MRLPSIRIPGLRVGSFQLTLTGMSATTTMFVDFLRIGPFVALFFRGATGTSNANTMTGTTIPQYLRPSRAFSAYGPTYDNGTDSGRRIDVATTGVITFNNADEGAGGNTAFTSSGIKGTAAFSICYLINEFVG